MIRSAHFILYVSDKSLSTEFYTRVLGYPARLNVSGMTEFDLASGLVLGLMPNPGIKRLLADGIPDPEAGAGIPRAELYLLMDDTAGCHARALVAGARELSAVQQRDWGREAGYLSDPDGHVLAFATVLR